MGVLDLLNLVYTSLFNCYHSAEMSRVNIFFPKNNIMKFQGFCKNWRKSTPTPLIICCFVGSFIKNSSLNKRAFWNKCVLALNISFVFGFCFGLVTLELMFLQFPSPSPNAPWPPLCPEYHECPHWRGDVLTKQNSLDWGQLGLFCTHNASIRGHSVKGILLC